MYLVEELQLLLKESGCFWCFLNIKNLNIHSIRCNGYVVPGQRQDIISFVPPPSARPIQLDWGGGYTNRIPCIYFIFILYSSISYNSHLHDPTPNQFTHISSLQREKLFSFVAILRHIGMYVLYWIWKIWNSFSMFLFLPILFL